MLMIKHIKLFISRFDSRLNDYTWMHNKFHVENKTIKEMSDLICCSPDIIQNKLKKHKLLGRDKILTTYTGRFHAGKHLIMKLLKKRYLKKIEQYIDEVYPKIESCNPLLLKDILTLMEKLDGDRGISAGKALGMTRKETYLLAAKFLICLHEYDSQYEERIDWFIHEIICRRDEFFFDESANPCNWFPNRDFRVWQKHFFAKRCKPSEKIFFVSSADATITLETQTDRWYRSIKKER